jgi:hypothetical protein
MKAVSMAHERFEFEMPASCEVVFDAFHYHQWRSRWDSLVARTRVAGGAPCPHVGAVTDNTGNAWMRFLSMKTRFVSYERPRIAAATMIGRSFPFVRWSASMKHKALDGGRSLMIYTYTFEVGPKVLRWLIEPVVRRLFDRQTLRRFTRLQRYLAEHTAEIERWQQCLSEQEGQT